MEKLLQIFDSNFTSAFGWTLLHSFWQGIALSLIYAIFQRLVLSSDRKYFLGMGLLLLQVILTIGTFYSLYQSPTNTDSVGLQNVTKSGVVILQSADYQLNTIQSLQIFFSQNLFLFVKIWMLGVVFLIVKFIISFAYAEYLTKSGLQNPSEKLIGIYNSVLEKIQISKSIRLYESDKITLPLVIGHFRPFILMPVGLVSKMSLKEIEAILIHEIAHIKRNDFLLNIFQSFIEIFYFFNPAIWWISSRIQIEREHCCDDFSVNRTGDKLLLVKALAQVESFRQTPQLAMAFGRKRNSLLNRVHRILEINQQKKHPNLGFIGAIVFVGLVVNYFIFSPQNSFAQTKQNPQNQGVTIKNTSKDTWTQVKTDTLPKKSIVQFHNDKNSMIISNDGDILINGKKLELSDEKQAKVLKHIKEIEFLEAQMKPHTDQIERYSKEIEGLAKNIEEGYSPQMQILVNQINAQAAQMNKNAKLQEKQIKEMSRLNEGDKRYVDLEKLIEKQEKEYAVFEKAIEASQKEMEEIEVKMQKYEAPIDSLSKFIELYEEPIEELSIKIEKELQEIFEVLPENLQKEEFGRFYHQIPPPSSLTKPSVPKPPRSVNGQVAPVAPAAPTKSVPKPPKSVNGQVAPVAPAAPTKSVPPPPPATKRN
jgi:bla regulator protein blaR1